MKINTFLALAAVSLAAVTVPLSAAGGLPEGWMRAGTRPQDYTMRVDTGRAHAGKASGTIQSKGKTGDGFGTLMQMFSAEDFRGKRLRLSGQIAAQNVKESAGLWMRVDGVNQRVLRFDNMENRALRGTSGWAHYEIALDVPRSAKKIAFGILLRGEGKVWIDDLRFETVSKSVPTTDMKTGRLLRRRPVGLGFEL